MRHAPDKEVVARLKELTSLADSEINEVAKAGRLVHLPANWSVIWEKTPADNAYYILEGDVSIRRNKEEIATLGAGDFIGEVAIVNHQLRSASVVSTTEVTMLNFSAENATGLAERIPRIAEAIRASTAQRLEANEAG